MRWGRGGDEELQRFKYFLVGTKLSDDNTLIS